MATGVATSVAIFNRSEAGFDFHNKFLPAAKKTANRIQKQLSKTDRVEALDIKKAYDTHIGKDFGKFKKQMFREVRSNLNVRTTDKQTLPGLIRNIEETTSEANINKLLNTAREQLAINEHIKDTKSLGPNPTKEQLKAHRQIKLGAFEKVNSYYVPETNGVGGVYSDSFMRKTKNNSGADGKAIMNEVHKLKSGLKDSSSLFLENESNMDVRGQIRDRLYNTDKLNKRFAQKEGLIGRFQNWITGSRTATLDDVLNSNVLLDKDMTIQVGSEKVNIKNRLKELKEAGLSGDSIVDKTLKIRTVGTREGKMYSTRAWQDSVDNFMSTLSYTIPGRLAKLQDVLEQKNTPIMAAMHAGKKAFAAGNTQDNVLERTRIGIYDELFQLDVLNEDALSNGTAMFAFKLSDNAVMKNGKIVSNRFGSRARTMQQMLQGDSFTPANAWQGDLAKAFDINQTGREDLITKWISNVKNKKQGIGPELESQSLDMFLDYVKEMSTYGEFQDLLIDELGQKYGRSAGDVHVGLTLGAKRLNQIMNDASSINKISESTVNKLRNGGMLSDPRAIGAMRIYDMLNDGEELQTVMNSLSDLRKKFSGSKNPELDKLVKAFSRDADTFSRSLDISTLNGPNFGTVSLDQTEALNARDMLKKELLKESILTQYMPKGVNDKIMLPDIMTTFRDLGIDGKELEDLHGFASWGLLQNITGWDKNSHNVDISAIRNVESMALLSSYFEASAGKGFDFAGYVRKTDKQFNSVFKSGNYGLSEIYYDEISEFDFIKKSALGEFLKAAWNMKDPIKDGLEYLMPSLKEHDMGAFAQRVKTKLTSKVENVFDKVVNRYNAVESNTHEVFKELRQVNFDDVKDVWNDKDTSNIFNYLHNTESGAHVKNALDVMKRAGVYVSEKLEGTTVEMAVNEIKRHENFVKSVKDTITGLPWEDMAYELVDADRWKAIDVRSIVENQNVQTLKEAGKRVFNEAFTGGRNNTENVSELTFGVFNFFNRLNIGLNDSMLSLSSGSTGSTADLLKNMTTKRILPAVLGYNALSYLNFEVNELTGTPMQGYAANIGRSLDLGVRKALSPFGGMIDGFKRASIFAEYFTGDQEYMKHDERLQWYEDGYSAMRSGGGWLFGSTEFRGQGIEYYQPNYWRRAHSDYRNVSIYGDPKLKWKNNPLPSLRYPLAPVSWLLDRYWLEKKNFDDRPYPLTAPMFEEGTPYGSILNATIGRVLKPQKMLPQARRALKAGGAVDARSIIERQNLATLNEASNRDDLLVLEGTDVRNATWTPYGNPYQNELNIMGGNVAGYNRFNNLNSLSSVMQAPGGGVTYTGNQPVADIQLGDMKLSLGGEGLFGRPRLMVGQMIAGINNNIQGLAGGGSGGGAGMPFGSGRGRMSGALSGGEEMSNYNDGAINFKNLINVQNNNAAFYHSKKLDGKMINKNMTGIYARDVFKSISQLSGIYDFIGGQLLGDRGYTLRYQNAGSMTSTSKAFWESGWAGGYIFGGSNLEIGRRFMPTRNKANIDVNPLVNSMPYWIPEQYRTGDPYSKVKKGDMRMPGRGYETLNDLHGDQFGDYGAYDRMKILGDIAPGSEEYKLWRSVAKQTVKDPYLVDQMAKIEERAFKASSKYDFYEYSYLKNTRHRRGVVQSINEDGTITLGNGMTIKMAGAKISDAQAISEQLTSGDKITYETSQNAVFDKNGVTNAIVFKRDGAFSANINKSLLDGGLADDDYRDRSGLARKAKAGGVAQAFGFAPVQEALAHAPIPFVHNMLFNIESAYEGWKSDVVHGIPFKTWDNPIRSYILPKINEARGQSLTQRAMSIAATSIYNRNINKLQNGLPRAGAALAMGTFAPDAYMAGSTAWLMRMNSGGGWFQKGVEGMSMVSTGLWAMSQTNNPIKAGASFAAYGAYLSERFKFNKINPKYDTPMMATAGALLGIGLSAANTNMFTNANKMFKDWAPRYTRKKWGLDEYFDRLEYIKYHGLYKRSMSKASAEGENLEYFFNKLDENKKEINRLKRRIKNRHGILNPNEVQQDKKILKLQSKIDALESEQQVFTGSKHAKAAIAYKKAMESTLYGLSESSTPDEIMSAIPDQYKDHFSAFMSEDDRKQRKKILKAMPKYLENPLRLSWGMKTRRNKSNGLYFGLLSGKKLPGMKWKGWNPNINLKHVKMKTVQNEGMLISDFGYYDAEKGKAAYQIAPSIIDYSGPIKMFGNGFGLLSYAKLQTVLSGQGLRMKNISVEETATPGLSIVGNVTNSISDKRRVASYETMEAMKMLPFI